MKKQILESQSFGDGKRNYFIDFAKSKSNTEYISINRSDRQQDGTYTRQSVVIFEDDFEFLIESFSMLFTSVIYRKETQHKHASQQLPRRGIKSWQPEDRPREKLVAGGAHALSDAELLATLIGSGTRKLTAVDLAQMILNSVGGKISGLSKLTYQKLIRFHGIGEAKAVSILSAVELLKRVEKTATLPFKLKVG